MAQKKENIKALFSNTRSRIIIIFTALLLIFAMIFGIIEFRNASRLGVSADAQLTTNPNTIRSIPGSTDPTAEYAKLQEAQNVQQAQAAKKNGTSAIPTIIKTQRLELDGQGIPANKGQGSVGFVTLARQDEKGVQRNVWLESLKNGHCNKTVIDQVLKEGASLDDLKTVCDCIQLKNAELTLAQLETVCNCSELKAAGINAVQLKVANFSVMKLKQCGFNACELKSAGFSAKDMAQGGFTPGEMKGAGYSNAAIDKAEQIPNAVTAGQIQQAGCRTEALTELRKKKVKASTIEQINGCSLEQLKQAGFGDSAIMPEDIAKAGCSQEALAKERREGVSASAIRANAGCSAEQLERAGFAPLPTPEDIAKAGCSQEALAKERKEGVNAGAIRANADCSVKQLEDAGFSPAEINKAIENADNRKLLPLMPSVVTPTKVAENKNGPNDTQQLQQILNRQNQQMNAQRNQQQVQQRNSEMQAAASQYLQNWRQVSVQVYNAGESKEKDKSQNSQLANDSNNADKSSDILDEVLPNSKALIKTGEILFGVLDTSVNSDEPGPILATVVSGRFKGAKLIGSFILPNNAGKMVISFNTISIPGAPKTTSINAYAIDPNTARTALSSKVNYHYLRRYGSLFASSFLEGFGNAFQSADTTVTIGGTGGGDNITVRNGINRSVLQNAVIGLATLGKTWGQAAQQQFATPTTVEVASGTGIGILFTQDLMTL